MIQHGVMSFPKGVFMHSYCYIVTNLTELALRRRFSSFRHHLVQLFIFDFRFFLTVISNLLNFFSFLFVGVGIGVMYLGIGFL